MLNAHDPILIHTVKSQESTIRILMAKIEELESLVSDPSDNIEIDPEHAFLLKIYEDPRSAVNEPFPGYRVCRGLPLD